MSQVTHGIVLATASALVGAALGTAITLSLTGERFDRIERDILGLDGRAEKIAQLENPNVKLCLTLGHGWDAERKSGQFEAQRSIAEDMKRFQCAEVMEAFRRVR